MDPSTLTGNAVGGDAGSIQHDEVGSSRSSTTSDESADGFLVVDATWACLFVDDSVGRVLHATPADLVGHNLWERCPELVGSLVDEQCHSAMAQQKFVAFNTYFPESDAWRSIRVFPSTEGLTIHWSLRSEQRRENDAPRLLAERLTSDERRYRSVLDSTAEAVVEATVGAKRLAAVVDESPNAIFTSTVDGVVTSWNGAAERLFGFTAEEVIGASVEIFAPPDRALELAQIRERLVAGGPPERRETVRRHKDGTLIDVLLLMSAATDQSGNVDGLSCIALDITDERASRVALELSNDRLAEAQRIAHVASFSFQVPTHELTWSTEYFRILSLDPASTPSIELFMSMVHPDDRSRLEQAWDDAVRQGLPFDLDVRIVRPDGGERHVHVRAVTERAQGGSVAVVAGSIMDNTEMRAADLVLRAAEARFEIGFEQSTIGAVISDLDGCPRRVNPAVCRLFGRSKDELIGRSWAEYTHPDDRALGPAALVHAMAGRDMHDGEWRFVDPDGNIVWAAVYVTLARDAAGEPQYFFTQMRDVTERKRMEADLSHQALHDLTTGLANRALLTDRLRQSLARARRQGAEVAVMFLGLDHFQLVNDSMGPEVGDQLLREVGARIVAAIRPGDTVARFGGDEFVVVADDILFFETQLLINRLRLALSEPCVIANQELVVTASIGIAMSLEGSTPESLLSESHAAMSSAKARGRDRVELFDETLRSDSKERIATIAALHHALERREFILHYQPIFGLATGTIVSAEALLRWDHPHGGLFSPDLFIPLAERTGLIAPIGAWVMEEAGRQLVRWQETHPSMSVAINLSIRQLLDPELVDVVDGMLRRTGVRPDRVCLELTESLFMADADELGTAVAGLKGLGVRLSIDDFGTGYSSLGRLRMLPVDELKIDRGFVKGLGADPHDTALVKAIIAMAAALDLSVIAEGVETRQQFDILDELGCQYVQGFYLAKPMPVLAMAELMTGAGGSPHR